MILNYYEEQKMTLLLILFTLLINCKSPLEQKEISAVMVLNLEQKAYDRKYDSKGVYYNYNENKPLFYIG